VRRSRLEKAAVRLVAAAGPADVVLVGGLAVALHGYVRATDDIDLVVRGPLADVQARLAAKGIKARLNRGDPAEGDFPCLRGELDGIRFDVLPELSPIDWAGAPELKVGGVTLRIVDLEGLLGLKLRAGGPQDLLDAAALILLHPDIAPVAQRLATAYGQATRLARFLEDPRLRAQVLDTKRRR
jgi:hypothetical protein